MKRKLVVTAVALALAAPGLAAAQENETAQLRRQIEELSKRLQDLETRQQATAQKVETDARQAPKLSATAEGFGLQSADGAFRATLHGILQVDGREYGGTRLTT